MRMERPKSLICPLCLDGFKNPTLLSCGHTFCKECPTRYGRTGNDMDHAYVECPMCRKRTRLDEDGIEGLPVNFLAKGLEDELQSKAGTSTSNLCQVHRQILRDILCETCQDFVCLSCFLENHSGHNVKKKEEIEAELKQKRDAALQKSHGMKAKLEKSITDVEHCKLQVYAHLESLRRDIRDAFSLKRQLLLDSEAKLIKDIACIEETYKGLLEDFIDETRESVDAINVSLSIVTDNTCTGRNLDSSTLLLHRLQLNDLDIILQQSSNEGYLASVKQTIETVQFLPAENNVLELGTIEPEKKTISDKLLQLDSKTTSPAVENVRSQVDIPEVIQHVPMPTVVKQVDVGYAMCGTIAALSQDSVVVSYGRIKKGSHCISVSGSRKEHLNKAVGKVYSHAFLSNGRSVVSHGKTCCVYNTRDGSKVDMYYALKGQKKSSLRLCSDKNDIIYAVNGSEIYIFYGRNRYPDRIVSTGNIHSSQICVTETGAIVTTDNAIPTLYIFNREGVLCNSIASRNDEDMCAALDGDDRLLLARLQAESSSLTLERYSLDGTEFTKKENFGPLVLPHNILDDAEKDWNYLISMVSLTPTLIAFSASWYLYFIELPAV